MSSPISGFTAIPNPQMLAFMPIQSYLMMYFAGAGWQIGKRKMSAIPNDEFNKMSAKQLLEGFTADLRSTIPTLERSLNDITPLIETLIKQYGEFVTLAASVIPKVAEQTAQDIFTASTSKEGTFANWLRGLFPSLPDADAKMMAKQLSKSVDPNLDPNKFVAPFRLPTSPVFQGPEINPRTGETTPFVQARKNLPPPAAHIVSRPRSNVSMQSLRIELKTLEALLRRATQTLSQERLRTGQNISTKRARVNTAANAVSRAQGNLADFLKMHGARF